MPLGNDRAYVTFLILETRETLTYLFGEVSSSVDVSSLESAESMIPPAHEGTQGSPSWYPLGPSVATR